MAWAALRALLPRDRRSVLIVTVDTLRADHMSCYGYERDTTPRVDALAREGVLFEQVTTPRAKTAPSMTSMLTGLYPHEHGVRTNFTELPDVRLALGTRDVLRPDPTSPGLLAERLRAAGFDTAAFVSNFVLTEDRSGLARGFETYDDELTAHELNRPEMLERTADETTDRAVGWLREHADDPFFLWVHYVDPHGAYVPPAEYDRFRSTTRENIPLAAMREAMPVDENGFRVFVAPHNLVVDPQTNKRVRNLGRYVDLYDGEIAFVDAEFGRLLDELRALGRLKDTLVVFTADHGESLGEHSVFFEHGYYVYEPSLRLPLVVRPPDDERFAAAERGRRISEPVDLLDIVPTVFDWLDIEPDLPLSGRSFAPRLAAQGGDAARVTFTERQEFGFVMRAARTAEWKLIDNFAHPPQWPLPFERELYDLRADPGETRNLYGSSDPRAVAAQARLGERLAEWIEDAGELGSSAGDDMAAVARLPDDARARLEAMGYVGGAATPEVDANALQYRTRAAPASDDPRHVLEWALSGSPAQRALALEALVRAGALDATDLAAYLAPDQPLAVRLRAAELAGQLELDELIEPLRDTLSETRPDDTTLRLAVAFALERLGEPLAVDELARAVKHWNAGVRAVGAWYVGQLARSDATHLLEPLTDDRSGTVRVLAWHALARLGQEGAGPALLAQARSRDPITVRAAVRALAEIGSPLETRQLVQALRAQNHPALVEAGNELACWASPGEAQRAWSERASIGAERRRQVVHAIGSTEGAAARPLLVEALQDDDDDVRVLAAAHLLRLDADR